MASTFSPILRIELIGTGDQSGTWGNTTNVNLGTLIEQAIAGTATIDVTAGNVTLTNYNGATDQARCMALRTTGTPGVSRNLVAPAVSKIYIVANGSNNTVVIKTSTSTGVTVPVGEVYLVYYDTTSTDFRLVGRASSSSNTANTLVLRDASGNFAAGTITATAFSGGSGAFTTLSSTGNTTLGDASADTLTVNASPTFNVAIPATSGGTGFSSYAIGDLLYANTNSTLAKLSDVATGSALISGGVGVAPSWGKIALAAAVSGTLPVANGGTGVTTSTGSGNVVLSTSPTLVTPVLGTPSSGTLTSCTGLPLTTGVTGTLPVANGGTGVTTSTGSGNNVLSTSPTLVTPLLGTPTSGTLTNCTGLPLTTGVTGTLPVANGGTGVTTSTGSGSNVLSASPALTGTPTAPTAAPGTSTTQIATTAFVQAVSGNLGTMATQNANNVSITGGAISGVSLSTTGTTNSVNGNVVGSNAVGARTVQAISAGVPIGGADGDIVYQY